jgi:YfiH family protein
MTNTNYLTPNWPVPSNIHAAMTLRTGGVSTGVYASLNPATQVGDNPDAVAANRAIIKQMLQLPSEPVWLNQIHSNRVIDLSGFKNLEGLESADASFTCESGVVCAVLTADCLPLLFCSQNGEKIAAVHAGWKGLLNGIISNVVQALKINQLIVWLGAAIGANRFEVGSEVRDLFIAKNPLFSSAFKQNPSGFKNLKGLDSETKWLADIYQLARIELAELGIDQVYGGEFCTVTDTNRFYSYRRDQLTGRMATLIWKD